MDNCYSNRREQEEEEQKPYQTSRCDGCDSYSCGGGRS